MTTEMSPWLLLVAIPLLLVVATAFTKVSVVLGALRVGLGARALLPWPAMLGLALVVTAIVMAPVALDSVDALQGVGGTSSLAMGDTAAWTRALGPLRAFMTRHASAEELSFFSELSAVAPTDPRALVPAFLVTELTEALHMAVLILLPLVLVDLAIAQLLTLMSLANAPGPLVTLPLKVLLFLAVGGWDVVIGGLVQGYA